MPLFSDYSNMYYSGTPSYSGSSPYSSYSSSTMPLGSSYSASYLGSGGTYGNHSSVGGYSRTPFTPRWIPTSGRNYSPILSTISERGTASPVRLNSPRRIPLTKSYASPCYTPRPVNINTADIDVSRDKYRSRIRTISMTPTIPKPSVKSTQSEISNYKPVDDSQFMPRVDGKPETGIDSSPGTQRGTIKRGRTVVRLHTLKRKERDSPRKPQESLPQRDDDAKDMSPPLDNSVALQESQDTGTGWRERLSEELQYKEKREKKTIGEKLIEKFIVKDKNESDAVTITDTSGIDMQKLNNSPNEVNLVPPYPQNPLQPSRSPDRRCSMELLAEQANLLDSLIRGENLSTASLDLSKIGVVQDSAAKLQQLGSIKRRKSNTFDNNLQTTKSDHSLHDRFKSLSETKESRNLSKKRSLKKSASGGSICRLDSITEFPKETFKLPAIEESRQSIKDDQHKTKPKVKPKITSSVEISPPKNALKFKVETVTVEEILCEPKKGLSFRAEVEIPTNTDTNVKPITTNKINLNKRNSAKEQVIQSINNLSSEKEDSEGDDGNFWDKIGKRETIYLNRRKQNIQDELAKNRRAMFWYPGDDETGSFNDNEPVEEKDSTLISSSSEINITEATLDLKENESSGGGDRYKPPELESEILNTNNDIDKDPSQTIVEENIISSVIIENPENSLPFKTTSTYILSVDNQLNQCPTQEQSSLGLTNEQITHLNTVNDDDVKKFVTAQENDTQCEKKNVLINECLKGSETYTQLQKNNKITKKVNRDEINVDKHSLIKENPKIKVKRTSEKEKQSVVHIVDKKTELVISNDTNIPIPGLESKSVSENPSEDLLSTCSKNVEETKKKSQEVLPSHSSFANDSNNVEETKKKPQEVLPSHSSFDNEVTIPVPIEEKNICLNQNAAIVCDKFDTNNVHVNVLTLPENENIPINKHDNAIENCNEPKASSLGEENKAEIKTSDHNDLKSAPESNEVENDDKTSTSGVVKLPVSPAKKPVKNEPATRPLIATPRPLQKKAPQVIHSSSSSESSSEDESSDDDDADESDTSEESSEFFECENNPDGRTSTGSNDSGFDSSAPTSPAGFLFIKKDCDVNCHRKCEKLTANLCGVNQRLLVEALASRTASKKGGDTAGAGSSGSNTTTAKAGSAGDIVEQELEASTSYGIFRKTGRFTPPARSIPRFRKYTIEDFHFIKVLGKGSFGKVLLAELRDTEYYYAVKCLKKDVVLEDDDVECTLIERKVLALGTNHPYLCHLFATFQTDSHLFFVMEYLNGGDLMFHIQQSGRFPEARARFYAAEIVSGLKFLHKRGIVYRDLKLDNILLDFDGHVRIADFGMCKLQIYLDKTADTFCGTPDYMAPEIIKGLKYSQTVDWWSFGVLLYEMLIGQSPFSGCDEDELFWSICNEMPSYPRFLSQEALTVLTRLLDKDARTRLGGAECMHGDVRDQDFFHAIHWERLERRELETPFKPRVRHPLDTQYFDRAFTGERPRLTAVEPHVLRSMDQEPFRGFSYTNPNATDR